MTAECLASCGTAPVLQVNDEFVENVTLEMADALVDEWDRELKANVGAQFIAPAKEEMSSPRGQ
jgi:hypothetical protein